MPLILFIQLSEALASQLPEYYVNDCLRAVGFDTKRMILSGVSLDGQRLWYAQERGGRRGLLCKVSALES